VILKLEEKLPVILRSFVSFFSVFLCFSFYRKKNSESEQSCYVFGDGPSIKYMDLKFFANLPSIATNEIINHVDFEHLDCKYWIMPEPVFFWPGNTSVMSDRSTLVRRYKRGLHPRALKDKSIKPILNVLSFPFTFQSRAHYFYYGRRHFKHLPIAQREDAFAGTINSAITIAIHLGYKKIYLIGFDYTHKPSTSLHWYEHGRGIKTNHSGYNSDYFKEALRYIDIVTVTIDAESEFLPFITYETLTGEKPRYKENFEILSQDRYETLRNHKTYLI
jgi:hypothetical protein